MKKTFLLAMLTLAFFVVPAVSFGVEITEEEITPRTRKIYIDPEDERPFFERGETKNVLSVTQGYDNNSHLDSKRDGDAFTQVYYRTTFTSPINERKKGILEYELMSLLYWGESSLSVVKNAAYIGIEDKFNRNITLSARYVFDWYEYTSNGNDDFAENRLELKARQELPNKMFHALNYSFGYRNFNGRHTRTSATTYSDKKRDDERNTVGYEIGKYFVNNMLKADYSFYRNNSDETYLHYYDYDSHKYGLSLTHLFNKKLFGLLAYSHQLRDFRNRTLSLDANAKEWDRTYLVSSALYYNLSESLTLGLSYSWRENKSNEPIENYAGSLIAVSTYYRF